jgi:endonuclease III
MKLIDMAIERYRINNDQPVKFVDDQKYDNVLNDLATYPHAFVLACLMDRQIKAEKAWILPCIVFEFLGKYSIEELASESQNRIRSIFE